ncbi:MAG TPA: decaprenyl-phosphate phosphoribosyltransferase [Armatimonadota bacterium]|nr:decaprenyl-phosphate phosphoribosyltransferase [Armatimonadota bacterium]
MSHEESLEPKPLHPRASEPRTGTASSTAQMGFPGALFKALRPRQWVKNAVLLAGILFTLNHGHSLGDWLRVAGGIAVFCALASAIYLVNDVCDLEQDRKHPRKRHRPIPAGLVSVPAALITAVLLIVGGMAGSLLLGPLFALTSLVYVLLTLAYSIYLKHAVIIDVMALAGCYVARAVAGAVVINVEISPWLLVCTMLGALLIGLAKRRNELLTLEDAGSHRRILEEYTVDMLDKMIVIVASSTLMAYMLYTFPTFSRTAQQRPLMMLTIPYVVYGVFRFLYQMHRHGKGGDPSSELVEDRNLMVCGILWALTAVLVMLFGR